MFRSDAFDRCRSVALLLMSALRSQSFGLWHDKASEMTDPRPSCNSPTEEPPSTRSFSNGKVGLLGEQDSETYSFSPTLMAHSCLHGNNGKTAGKLKAIEYRKYHKGATHWHREVFYLTAAETHLQQLGCLGKSNKPVCSPLSSGQPLSCIR